MFLPEPLPRTLFEEIGKIVVLWATIEQDILLQTSALASQDVGGKTTEWLRLDFKRLRTEWLKQCRKHFSEPTINKVVLPLNVELARLSDQRGLIVHGRWLHSGRGKFLLDCFEQKGQLIRYESDVTLGMLREIRHDTFLLSKRVYRFTIGQDGDTQLFGPVLKTISPVIPADKN